MDPRTSAELRALRARAYGPDADIHDDAVAIARLNELEARAAKPSPAAAGVREPGPPVGATRADETAAGSPTSVVEAGDGAAAEGGDAAAEGRAGRPASAGESSIVADAVPSPRPRWSRRRIAVAWAVSLVVGIVAATAVSAFAQRRAGYEASVEAVLARIPDAEPPPFLGLAGDQSRTFSEFHGVTVIATGSGWMGPNGGECLYVVESASIEESTSSSWSGFMTTGCGAGPFPATVELTVLAGLPQSLRERYPDDTALQFRLEGDEVVVLSAPPDESENAAPAGPG